MNNTLDTWSSSTCSPSGSYPPTPSAPPSGVQRLTPVLDPLWPTPLRRTSPAGPAGTPTQRSLSIYPSAPPLISICSLLRQVKQNDIFLIHSALGLYHHLLNLHAAPRKHLHIDFQAVAIIRSRIFFSKGGVWRQAPPL